MQDQINNSSMLKVGTILHGTYRIDSYLSSGGFGNTYVATNIEFDERVAIKEFFIKGVTERDNNQTTVSVSNIENKDTFLTQREKFKKEARRLRKLSNEHLVKVYDLFDENGTTYYVMDYVDGENLAERLKRTGRPMTESEVRLILPQILDALKVVHTDGFCHLDIKPSNIMLEKGGKVKLIDFGASKQLGSNGTLTTNAPSAFAQTPGYAPREQMEQNLDKIGPWTDVYALGATLYNLLTFKKPPLPTDIDDDLSEDKHVALPFPEGVGGMKSLVLQMMKTNRLQRPQSIDAIISAEKPRMEEPKPNHNSTLDYDEEDTFIAQPQSENGEKGTESHSEGESRPSDKSTSPTKKGEGFLYAFFIFFVIVLLLLFIISVAGGSKVEPRKIHAAGISWNSPLGSCRYSGYIDTWDDFNPHGAGEVNFNDGRYYRGGFNHGVFTGKNTLYKYPNGDSFEGEFRNNTFYYGVYRLKEDNSYYCGPFVKDERNPQEGAWFDEKGNKLKTERISLVNIKGIEVNGYKRSQN